MEGAASGFLRQIHGCVRIPEQVLGRFPVRRIDGDADADAGLDTQAFEDEWLRYGGQQLAPKRQRRLRIGKVGLEDRKFVAAQPGNDIGGLSNRRAQPLRDGGKQPVAGIVTEGVVDQLEIVHIEE